MTPLADLKAQLMKDEAFHVAYAEADAEFRVIEAAIRARMDRKATQQGSP